MLRPSSGVLILMTGALAAFGGHPKVAQDLDNVDPESRVDVIVQYRQAPTVARHQRMRAAGGLRKRSLHLIQGASYSVSASELENLSNDPEVLFVSRDNPVHAAATPTLDYFRETVNSAIANANTWKGTGIGVAVLDSGIFNFGDLSNVVYTESFVDGAPAGIDGYGHGTHVAGILAGNGLISNGTDYQFGGVAPGVKLLDFRVLDNNGVGTDSGVIAAIQRAIALKSTYNIRVINLSLGRPVTQSHKTDPL